MALVYDNNNPFKLQNDKLIPLSLLEVLEGDSIKGRKNNMLLWKNVQALYGGQKITNETLYQYYMQNAFNGMIMTRRDIQDIARNIRVIHNWNLYKQVYKFDQDWFDYLVDNFTFDKKLQLDILEKKLPYSSFFVDNITTITNDVFRGFFIDITDESTYDWSKEYKTLTMCFVMDNIDFGSAYTCIPLRNDMTLEELFKYVNKYSEDENEMGHFLCMKIALAICFYLSADNKDIEIRQGKSPKEVYELKKTAKKGIKQASIGIRLGNTIREHKVKYVYEGNEHNKGSKKSPHIRGGHYHQFWTGKKDGSEERKLVLHYLEPMFIGGSVEKTTIHKVKR